MCDAVQDRERVNSSEKSEHPPRRAEANKGSAPSSWSRSPASPPSFILLLAIGAVLVSAFVGYHIASSYRSELTRWADRQASVADDRAGVIASWLRERQADAEVLASLPSVRSLLGTFPGRRTSLAEASAAASGLRQLLDRFAGVYGFSGMYLLRPDGKLVAQATGSPPIGQRVLSASRAMIDQGRASIDLWGNSPQEGLVSIAVPVFELTDDAPIPPDRVIGAVVLELDAVTTLYPLLMKHPVPTKTGETYLVRRSGADAEFISPLRFQAETTGFFRSRLTDTKSIAHRALVAGEAVGEFVDYRGVHVVAATRMIPGTGWTVVRKVDRSEALASFYRTALLEGLAVCFLFLASAGIVRGYRHKAMARFFETQVEEQRDLLKLKEYAQEIVDSVPAGLLVLSSDLHVLAANRSFLESYGLQADQVIGRRLDEVVKAEGPPYRVASLAPGEIQSQSVLLLDVTVPGLTGKRPARISLTNIAHPEGEGRLLMVVEDQTESERLRSVAETSERRLRDLVQTVDAIVWEADFETLEFSFVSQVAEKILGYSVGEWCWNAEFWPRHLYAPDHDRVVSEWRSRAQQEDDYELEYRMVAADGRIVWLRDMVRVVRDPGGRPRQLRGVMVDVTEGRRAEEELRRVNRALKTLSECNRAMTHATEELAFLNDICQIIVEVGEYRFAWVGVAETDEEKTIRAIARAGAGEGYLEAIRKTWAENASGRGPSGVAIRTQQPCIVRDIGTDLGFAPWRHEAAQRGYASVIGLPLVADARAFGVLVIYSVEKDAFDIEEVKLLGELAGNVSSGVTLLRTRAERQKIEEERARLSSAVEQATEAILITDGDGTIEYVNPAFEHVTGYARSEVVGENPRILKSGKQEPEFYRDLWATLREGRAWSGRFINRRKDGTFYEAEAAISPVRDASGRVVNFVAVERDVTKERQLEDQVRQSQRVEAVGRLAGGVAHDFNNLLTIITGYSDLLLDRLDEADPSRPHVTEIRKAADRAASLTRQLLAFSRRQVLTPQVLDLNSVVANMHKMLRRLIGEDVELVTIAAQDLWRVKVDPGQVEQVLLNLAINSRDAMPRGGKITVETANTHLDEKYAGGHFPVIAGPYVMLAVSDTGCGMDAETQAHIFEPFFTTKEQGKGTGLGLSMVYGIVKQSGGYIWVYSEVGRGTTFKIYFPCVEEQPSAAHLADVKKVEHGGSETILLVEDEPSVRSLVSGVLRTVGYHVLVARNGEDARIVSEQHKGDIHLLVTDVVMPEVSGPQLAEQMTLFYKNLKVLYISGYTDDAIVHHGVLDSTAAFLQKPFTPEALARKVREVLDST